MRLFSASHQRVKRTQRNDLDHLKTVYSWKVYCYFSPPSSNDWGEEENSEDLIITLTRNMLLGLSRSVASTARCTSNHLQRASEREEAHFHFYPVALNFLCCYCWGCLDSFQERYERKEEDWDRRRGRREERLGMVFSINRNGRTEERGTAKTELWQRWINKNAHAQKLEKE